MFKSNEMKNKYSNESSGVQWLRGKLVLKASGNIISDQKVILSNLIIPKNYKTRCLSWKFGNSEKWGFQNIIFKKYWEGGYWGTIGLKTRSLVHYELWGMSQKLRQQQQQQLQRQQQQQQKWQQLTWKLFSPLVGDACVMDVVMEWSVSDGLDEVDAERVPERTERVAALRVAPPILGVALQSN